MKVLYAEDDPLTVMEVAEQLEERGFEVIVADDNHAPPVTPAPKRRYG